ncbi:MAG: hypothetical protein NT069_05675 [Planctomycetota bacterium]|nr:hypothetical protein [Planctomycetota bacterium]
MPNLESPVFLESLSRLIARWGSDPDFRLVARQLAQVVLDATEEVVPGGAGQAPGGEASPASPLRRIRAAATAARATSTGEVGPGAVTFPEESPASTSSSAPMRPHGTVAESEPYRGVNIGDLTLGRGRSSMGEMSRPGMLDKFVPVDFALIESRCRLKACGV